MSKGSWTLAALVVGWVLIGCASQPTPDATAVRQKGMARASQVSVTIQDYKFMPDELRASAGQKLHLTIKNDGHEEHGMEFDFPSGVVSLPSHVRPGETEQFDLKAPDQAGTYYFHCPVGNHYARGMEGTLVVQ